MEEEQEVVRESLPRWRIIAFSTLLLLLLLILAVWTQRKTIAGHFIDRELERRGVQAHYRIAKLGLGLQELDDVVIGDPAHPDLTADQAIVQISYGLRAPRITKVTARGVRLYGRLVGGRLKLGEVDKLMPPPSGAPFTLPDLNVDVADAGLRLDTPFGRLGFSFEGRGNLADGFRGRAAASSERLLFGSCSTIAPKALLSVSIASGRPSLKGPVRATNVSCPTLHLVAPSADIDATLEEALDGWNGKAGVQLASAVHGLDRIGPTTGKLSFSGNSRLTKGGLTLSAANALLQGSSARRLIVDTSYSVSPSLGRVALDGTLKARSARASRAVLASPEAALQSLAGTPLEPIGRSLAAALRRTADDADFDTTFAVDINGGRGGLRLTKLGLSSRSGARATLDSGEVSYGWPKSGLRVEGQASLSGGGWPAIRANLSQPAPGSPLSGVIRVAPMRAGGARVQLADVQFRPGPGASTSIRTAAIVDGPLGDGRITGLALPIEGRFGRAGFAFGERCTTVAFRSLALSSLRMGATRLPLCPTGPALLWKRNAGPLQGGAEARNLRLAGAIGSTPISVAPDRLRFDLGRMSFAASNVRIRLGRPEAINRFDLASLTGAVGDRGVAGTFAGGAGKIANVPLLISQAGGRWSFAGGAARIDGDLMVADEATEPRFVPLRSRDFHLTLAGNRIDAQGWLEEPKTGTRVTQTTIVHALNTGRGHAVLDIPGLTFGEGFQPEQLTRLTTGVVALVKGRVAGRGEIDWSPEGTSSTGSFSTEKMNLAAPFGPVEGLTTTINFSDLLGLVTEPGQLATVDRIQAGIDVFDGRVRYRLLPGLKVQVEEGVWPFAGGELALQSTILDFSQPSAKHLTFKVTGLDAASFVQQMQFTNISTTGTFDGLVPMVFDESGGRIAGGHLQARSGGGVVSYIGELTDKQLGTYGKLAFDALKSLRYSKLSIDLNGALDGEFVAGIELDGIARNAPAPNGIVGAALNQLAKIPFEFNITARGPFRALIGTMRSLKDPSGLIQTAISNQLGQQTGKTNVQLQESEDVR